MSLKLCKKKSSSSPFVYNNRSFVALLFFLRAKNLLLYLNIDTQRNNISKFSSIPPLSKQERTQILLNAINKTKISLSNKKFTILSDFFFRWTILKNQKHIIIEPYMPIGDLIKFGYKRWHPATQQNFSQFLQLILN